jgi:hypothetical protein
MFRGIDSTGAVSNFQCSIDNKPYTSCASGVNYPRLTVGSHYFAVSSSEMGLRLCVRYPFGP